MASREKLKAVIREERGSAEVKKMRDGGMVPGVVYGHKTETLSIAFNEREFMNKTHGISGGHLFDLEISDDSDSRKRTVLIREIQKDAVKNRTLHVDFQQIAMDEKIETNVAVRLIGEAIGVKLNGGVVDQHMREMAVRVLPAKMPDHIEVDITALDIGDSVRVADVVIPEDCEILNSVEDMVVAVLPPTKVEEKVEELVEEEGAEPELVGEKETPEAEEK